MDQMYIENHLIDNWNNVKVTDLESDRFGRQIREAV